MLDVLSSLVGTVGFLITYLIDTIKAFVDFIILIPRFVGYLGIGVGFLPFILIPFATAYISLYALLFVLRKN